MKKNILMVGLLLCSIANAAVVPVLQSLTTSVAENSKAGTKVGTIKINKVGDSTITSITLSGTGNNNFSVAKNGTMTVRSGAKLDYEAIKQYKLTAVASNKAGKSKGVSVIVNVKNINDVVPVLGGVTLSVAENAAAGTKVGAIKITKVGDSAISAITLTGTGNNNFNVATNGTITVKSGAILDYEATKQYKFTAVATNKAGKSNSVIVIVNVTNIIDLPPKLIAPATQSIREDVPMGTKVLTIGIGGNTSDEKSINSFTIVSGDTNGDFKISNTGVITTNKALDYEKITAYTLKIKATNNAGDSSTVNSIITIIDVPELPVGFIYPTINNSNTIVQTTLNDYIIKIFSDYKATADQRANHVGIMVNINGEKAPLMSIQSTYIGHQIVVGVYNNDNTLLAVSNTITITDNTLVEMKVNQPAISVSTSRANTNSLQAPRLLSTLPSTTYEDSVSIQISGKAESTILINGEVVDMMNSEGTATVTLYTTDVQTYLFTITLEDAIGNRSDALMLSVRREIEE